MAYGSKIVDLSIITPRSLGDEDRMLHVADTTPSNCTQLGRVTKIWLLGLECRFPWISAIAKEYGDICVFIPYACIAFLAMLPNSFSRLLPSHIGKSSKFSKSFPQFSWSSR